MYIDRFPGRILADRKKFEHLLRYLWTNGEFNNLETLYEHWDTSQNSCNRSSCPIMQCMLIYMSALIYKYECCSESVYGYTIQVSKDFSSTELNSAFSYLNAAFLHPHCSTKSARTPLPVFTFLINSLKHLVLLNVFHR